LHPLKRVRLGGFLLAIIALGGCALKGGDDGDAGLVGPPGLPGPPGPQGLTGYSGSGQLVFKDATGQYVGPTDGQLRLDAQYTDDRGFHWLVEGETGELTSLRDPGGYFETADCTGLAHLGTNIEARMPFKLWGENAYRVITDSLVSVPLHALSRWGNPGVCESLDGTYQMYPMGAGTLPNPPILKPSVSFVGPLHLERE
jgi:hypothetical protein